jgi:hypothetical protein
MARMTVARRKAEEELDRMFGRHQDEFNALAPAQQDVYRRAFRAVAPYEENHQRAMQKATAA